MNERCLLRVAWSERNQEKNLRIYVFKVKGAIIKSSSERKARYVTHKNRRNEQVVKTLSELVSYKKDFSDLIASHSLTYYLTFNLTHWKLLNYF